MAARRSSSLGWISASVHHRPSAVPLPLDPHKQIQDINSQVAQFRDLLINIGQPRDSPELRERIRKLRRSCVEACKNTSQLVLPQIRRKSMARVLLKDMTSLQPVSEAVYGCGGVGTPSLSRTLSGTPPAALGRVEKFLNFTESAMDLGIPADSPNLVLLFFVTQLFLRELYKSKNLLRIVPMDMTGYYESKAGPSNIGNVISQILLCKQITPNFNEEELCSIQKDSEEINALIKELQEFMPQSEADTEKHVALQDPATRTNGANRASYRWDTKSGHPSYFQGSFNFLCCTGRPANI